MGPPVPWPRLTLAAVCLYTGFAKDVEMSRIADFPQAEAGNALLASRQVFGLAGLAVQDVDDFSSDSAHGKQKGVCESSCHESTEYWRKKCQWSTCNGCPKCIEKGCTVPDSVEHAATDGICQEGSFIPFYNKCTIQCQDGYGSPWLTATCKSGVLLNTPQCYRKNCSASTANAASSGLCVSGGSKILHGSTCHMACKHGYVASAASLSCFGGQITPPTYSCDPAPCSSPLDVEHAASPSCAEGSTLDHNEKCTAKCVDGYLPNITSTTCSLGALKHEFKCVEMWPEYGKGFCQDPVRLSHRYWVEYADHCKDQCEAKSWCHFYAYSQTAPSDQRCWIFERCQGLESTKSGTDFSNHTVYKKAGIQDCVAPMQASVSHGAALSCDGHRVELNSGATIYWGAVCSAMCLEGFEPSATSLHCVDGGLLSPPSFTCTGKSCSIKWVSNQVEGGVCALGYSLPHRSNCTMRCKDGYTASASTLSCSAGQLTPSTYGCSPSSCGAPSIAFSRETSCAEGATIGHWAKCTPACTDGYFADSSSVTCKYGDIPNFTCVKHWPIYGSGGCSAIRNMSHEYKNDGDACQSFCASRHWCHYFAFKSNAPAGKRCFLYSECDVKATTFNGTDLTNFTIYHAEYAQDCDVPKLLSPDPLSGDRLDCSGKAIEFGSGDIIPFGDACTMVCAKGYTPTAKTLKCGDHGELDPPSIMCEPADCTITTKIDDATSAKCLEGLPVKSGTNCTPACVEGFVPTQTSLKCSLGTLEPQYFECTPAPCDIGLVANAPPSGVCNGTVDHSQTCYPKCAEGYYPTLHKLHCKYGTVEQGAVFCEPEPTWWVEEAICKDKCSSWKCRSKCTYRWAPAEIELEERDCMTQCELDELLGKDLPTFCSRCGRPEARRLYDLGALDFPAWRIESYKCFYAETYTGFSPSQRTGLPGCYWLTTGETACKRECDMGTPLVARTYMLVCEDECLASTYTGLSAESISKAKDLCTKMCEKHVAERINQEEEAKQLLGDDGNETVSSEALQNLAEKVLELEQRIVQIRLDATNDAQQALSGLMHAQSSSDEVVRLTGSSGVTKVRTYKGGSRPYLEATHTSSGPQSAHNHANNANTVGVGELAAIMNGVSFRTRHNDYGLVMPGRAPMNYHQTEPVPRPEVPPSVLQAGSIEGQIAEMRMYFKAFRDQNVSLRDYRPYFKPVLCYLEGAWEKLESDDLVEPFVSDRHHIAATGWKDLLEKVRFFDFSGGKDPLENVPWLPTTVLDMSVIEGRLVSKLAKWSYRILCHPIDGDVELIRLTPQLRDWATYRRSKKASWEKYLASRHVRYAVNPILGLNSVKKDPFREVMSTRNYLDLLMEQIPGKDGYGATLADDVMTPRTFRLEPYTETDPDREQWGTAINSQHVEGPLNVAYYSRYFGGSIDAMGRAEYRRGYSDANLWAAMTTQQEVAKLSMLNSGSKIKPGDICVAEDGTPCPRVEQSWTYALPVEIIYLNPLQTWNPYDVEIKRHPDTGDGTKSNPFSNAGQGSEFYLTPSAFFGSCSGDTSMVDAADTSVSGKYVRGKDGVAQIMKASGVYIMTPCIQGLGEVRQRYNIMPLHVDGNTVYKEIQALGAMVLDGQIPDGEPEPEAEGGGAAGTGVLELALTAASDGHQHELVFDADQVDIMQNGTGVWVVSSFVEGHTHQVRVGATHNTEDASSHDWIYIMKECLTGGSFGPNPTECVDGHNALLFEFQSA